MATQEYSTVPQRNLLRAEYQLLKMTEGRFVLGKYGEQKEQPLRHSDTVVYRRLLPFKSKSNETPDITAERFRTSEGITPTANTISFKDVTVKIKQYAVLFRFSSMSELMYEDDIPKSMKELTSKTMAEVAELVAYGEIKAGNNVIYANGSTRAGINHKISLAMLRLAQETMENNRAEMVTSEIKAGQNFDTHPISPSYLVFISTNSQSDVEDLPRYVHRVEYGSALAPVHDREIGAVGNFRFITSPLFTAYASAGSATLNGMKADDETNVDVYPSIVMGQDAFAHVSLKGHGYTGISPTLISSKVKNHANPTGMFGYVGADFWYACKRTNENWMVRLEHGTTDQAAINL